MLNLTEARGFTYKNLTTAIIRDPIVVSPEMTVREAIARMNEARSHSGADSIEELDQRQLEARASCVVVLEGSHRVIGILTERDVVRLCVNHPLLDEVPVRQVVITPVLTLRESALTDLFSVIHTLQQNHIRYVPIVDDQDGLLGLVTHETLQQVLQPTDLLRLLQQEQVVAHLATQIRSSLSLQTILETAVEQIHQVMGCDRVNIWKFEPDCSTVVVAESTDSSRSLMGERVRDACYQQHITEVYREGYIRVVPDIYTTEMTDCHRELLISLGTRAKVLLPLFCREQLWGLLNVSESQTARDWQADEVELLCKLATQLTIAIQQASTHGQLQAELQERQQAEAQLRQSTERLQEAQRIAKLGDWEHDLQHNTLYWSEEIFRLFELDPQQCCPTFETFWGFVPPEDQVIFSEIRGRHLCDRQPYQLVHRLQMPDGRVKYVKSQCETTFSADGTPLISRGTVQDITQQQEAEIRREWAEASLRQVIEGTAAFTGEAFFPALVRHISEALRVRCVSVGQATSEGFHVLAYCADGELCLPQFLPYEWVPCCYQTLQAGSCCHPSGLQALYPGYTLFTDLQAESYLGVRLHNTAGEPIGSLCIFHDAPLADPDWAQTLLSTFAPRAGAELERFLTSQALEQLNAELEERVTQRTTMLAEREARYRGLLEGAADAILMADLQGNILEANQKAEALFGYPLAELTTLHFTQLHPPEVLPRTRKAFTEMAQKQRTQILDVIFRRPDGSTVSVDITAAVIELNGVTLVQGIFRDNSERKAIERALQESQQFLQTVLDTVPLRVFWKDRESRYLGANARFLADAALSSAFDILGKNDFDMPWAETEAEAYRADDRTVIDAGEAKLGIIETQHQQDGTEIWLETNKLPLRNLAGEIIGVLGTYQDITDRREGDITLRRHLAAIEAAIDSIAILQDERYVYLNSSHVELFGYQSNQELIGQSWRVLYSPEALERFDQEIWPALYDRMFWQGEVTATRKNGTTFPQQLSLTLLADNLLICVSQDISDRKQAETERQNLTNRLTLALQAGAYGTWDWDLVNDPILDERACEIYGLQTLGRSPTYQEWRDNIVHPDDIGWVEAQFETALCDRTPFNAEFRFWRTDGELRWIQIIAKAEYDAEGNPVRVAGINCDITDRKAAEMLIRQQIERETLLREMTQLILQRSLNLDEILATVTHQAREVLKGDRVIIFRLYPDGSSQIVEEAVSDGLPHLRDKHWDDEVWSQDILDHYWQGQPRIVPDVMGDRWTECLVEYSIEGQIQSKIVAPLLQEVRSYENNRWVSPRTQQTLWGILVIHACTEKRVWLETEAQLLQQIANQLAIAIQQMNLFKQLQQELAERQQTQKQLTESNYQLAVTNQELARATRLKDEFLANMSHELRTPLNAILGMSEIILEEIFGVLNSRQKQYLEVIQSSGQHLLNLINDILDVAKIASGQITLEYSHVAVEQLCSSSLAFIAQQALNKRIKLETNIQPHLPNIFADEIRIRQVLLNLLTNAVKFTLEGGTVTLTVSLIPPAQDTPQPTYLRIVITDTGIGIAPENIPKLFKPFVQIDGALNRQQTGTGLGLALVKQIVELHGGQVELTSNLGEGSCFIVDLPYATQVVPASHAEHVSVASKASSSSPYTSPTSTQAPLVLVAEDNPTNIATLSSYLEASGYRLLIANDGQEAVDLALSHHPDMILMDVQMPGVDGLEAMKQIRQQESLHGIPIIALTALAMKGDEERCLAAGADYYLSKPVKLKQLNSLIRELLCDRSPES